MKGFNTGDGYMGLVDGKYILFASESDVMWKTGWKNGILLKQKEKQEDFVKYLSVFLKQTIDCIYIRFSTTM